MSKIISIIACLLWSLGINPQSPSISLNGADVYINGINIPWNNFGWDFGSHYVWGNGYSKSWFEETFNELESEGVNCIRIWLHCDGRASPEFDGNGYVTGLDAGFLDQLKEMVEIAESHSLMVILTLWSHDMLEDYSAEAGIYAGLHKDLITDGDRTESYVQHALIPMVEKLSGQCNVLAWEIMNEPEWCMDIGYGGTTEQTVTKDEMLRFVGSCVKAIRAHSDQNITIGSAKPVGNKGSRYDNYWHEDEFHRLGFDCTKVYFDFYSFHYYDYMGARNSPFEQNAMDWQLGKPILIAETSSIADQKLSPGEQLRSSLDKGYAGVVFWSYNANDEYSDWQNCRNSLYQFSVSYPEQTAYSAQCDSIYTAQPLLICTAYPNPATTYLNLNLQMDANLYNAEVSLLNAVGKNVKTIMLENNDYTLSLTDLQAGFYYLSVKVLNKKNELLQNWTKGIILSN